MYSCVYVLPCAFYELSPSWPNARIPINWFIWASCQQWKCWFLQLWNHRVVQWLHRPSNGIKDKKQKQQHGCFPKWWYPQNTPKWSFLVGKPMVVGYHHFRKPPHQQQQQQQQPSKHHGPSYRMCQRMRTKKGEESHQVISALITRPLQVIDETSAGELLLVVSTTKFVMTPRFHRQANNISTIYRKHRWFKLLVEKIWRKCRMSNQKLHTKTSGLLR